MVQAAFTYADPEQMFNTCPICCTCLVRTSCKTSVIRLPAVILVLYGTAGGFQAS